MHIEDSQLQIQNTKLQTLQQNCLLLAGFPLALLLQMPLKYSHNIIVLLWSDWRLQALNVALCYLLFCACRVFISRNGTAFRAALTICFFISTVSHYVELARGYCLGPADIYNIQSAFAVMKSYPLVPDLKIHVLNGCYLILFMLSYKVLDNTKYPLRFYWRLISLICIACTVVLISHTLKVMKVATYQDDSITATWHGYFTFCVSACNELVLTEPAHYNADMFTQTPNDYLALDTTKEYTNSSTTQEGVNLDITQKCENLNTIQEYANLDVTQKCEKRPNVVMIMNESFADLASFGTLGAEKDVLPFIHSLQTNPNAFVGKTNVYIKGSGTSNTEYTALSGYSMHQAGSNVTPYCFVKIGKITPYSIVQNFKAAGYKTFAIHPYDKVSYYREPVYNLLGFDDARFIDSIQTPYESFDGMFASDIVGYKEILQELQETENPAYTFYVTMQNHGEFDIKSVPEPVSTKWDNTELSIYLAEIEKSDQDFKWFLNEIDKLNEDTIVIMFGDHQPYIEGLEQIFQDKPESEQNPNDEYITPLVMYSNYGLQFTQYGMPDTMMVQYVPAHIVEMAGVPTNQWLTDLLQFEKSWPNNYEPDESTIQQYTDEQYYIFCTQ